MLFRDLKATANESLFNPNNPDKTQKILLDVGNPRYWTTRAMERILEAHQATEGSTAYHNALREAVTLLLLARVKVNEKPKKDQKARKRPARPDSSVPQTP